MKQNLTKKYYHPSTWNVQLKIDELFAENVIPANDSVRLKEMHESQGKVEDAGFKDLPSTAVRIQRTYYRRGILLRMNRSIQSEGAFGVMKPDYGFRQFLLRGSKIVLTEILLLAMAYNVNKYHAKIQNNRTGTQLFEKDLA